MIKLIKLKDYKVMLKNKTTSGCKNRVLATHKEISLSLSLSLSKWKLEYSFLVALLSITIISGLILSSSTVSANDNVVDKVSVKVPVSCSMSGTGMNSHTATLVNGTYTPDIGTTTLHAFCNDSEGFAIYAAGYTGNDIGQTNSNKLVGTSASNNATMDTGIATSAGNPDVSNWAMKLAITQDSGDITGTNAFTIDSAPNTSGGANASFSQYHVVPNEYTKVAHKNSNTDMTATTGGVKLTTTYAAYISKTQVADTYSGKVIYTLIHPSNHDAPVAHPAVLDTGKTVNSKLRSLAATVINGEETIITPEDYNWYDADNYIKSITVHLETPVPSGFTPAETNTISSSASSKPIYAVFDNTNNAGAMHFYTEGEQIFLSPDSSFMFYLFYNLSEISGISDWDTSNVTDMSYMFYQTGYSATAFSLDLSSWDTSNVTDMSWIFWSTGKNATTFILGISDWNTSNVTNMSNMFGYAGSDATTWSIGNLSSWNTSSVTDMGSMFGYAGYSATTWSIGNLSSWDTSSVTSMNGMFHYAGYSATTFNISYVSDWDTSNVTDMGGMFGYAGYSATTWSIGNLSSWDTSSVTSMYGMFNNAGYSATTFILDISDWNTSNVTDMGWMFYGAGSDATTFILDISDWNTSNVTNMGSMFGYAGSDATTFILDISDWNTSNVTDMSYMFSYTGRNATTFTLDLSSWDTSSVTNMYCMFQYAGYSATTWSIGNLSSWDTSSVTSMNGMFYNAGYSATTFTLDLSSWNTSNVTNMGWTMFYAGYSATSWSITIPPTNGNNISNTTSRLYGKTTSTYGTPPSGKSFTLAQP